MPRWNQRGVTVRDVGLCYFDRQDITGGFWAETTWNMTHEVFN